MPKLMPLIQPDAAVTEEYYKRLAQLIRQMSHSVNYWVTAAFNQDNQNELAQDAEGETIEQAFNRRGAQWRKTYEKRAGSLARWFVTAHTKSLRTRRRNVLRKIGFTIRPTYSKAERMVIDEAVLTSTDLIKKIERTFMNEVREMLRETVAESRGLNYFEEKLAERTDITLRRASFIARDQTNKVHNDLSMSQDKSVGVTEGIWIHIPGHKTARFTHVEMDGERFRLDEGIMDNDVGRMVKPAELPGCACMYRALMPTLDERMSMEEEEQEIGE